MKDTETRVGNINKVMLQNQGRIQIPGLDTEPRLGYKNQVKIQKPGSYRKGIGYRKHYRLLKPG